MCWGVPARVIEVQGVEAVVDFGGGVKRRVLLVTEGVKPGDYVVVHAGAAIGKIKPKEALEVLEAYKEALSAVSPDMVEVVEAALEELRRVVGEA